MAWGIMTELKEPMVCDKPCQHKDCEATRKMVGSLCAICQKPIISGERFQFDKANAIQHALCGELEAEREGGLR